MRETLIHSRIKGFLSTCIVTAFKESQDKLQSVHNYLEEDEGSNEIVRLVYEPTGTDIEMTDLLIQNILACHVRNWSKYYPRLTEC